MSDNLQIQESLSNEDNWFPQDYTPGFSVDDWVKLLLDKSVFSIDALKIVKRMKDCGGQATCKLLSVKYGGSSQFYNSGSSSLARQIVLKTKCPQPLDQKDSRWWPVLYKG